MYEGILCMTESEVFEQIGRKRSEYRERKKELALVRSKAADLAALAGNISLGLVSPERIRWFDGSPMIGRSAEHVIINPAKLSELSEANIKSICSEVKRLEAVILSLRTELTQIDEDPER